MRNRGRDETSRHRWSIRPLTAAKLPGRVGYGFAPSGARPRLPVLVLTPLLVLLVFLLWTQPSAARSSSDPLFRGSFTQHEPGGAEVNYSGVLDAQRDTTTNVVYGLSTVLALYGTCQGPGRPVASSVKLYVPDLPLASDGGFSYSGPIGLGPSFAGGVIDVAGRLLGPSAMTATVRARATGYEARACPMDSGTISVELDQTCTPLVVSCTPGPPLPTVAATSGTVRVRLAESGTFVPLTATQPAPFGSVIDTSHGRVKVTSFGPQIGAQSLSLFGGEFELTQGLGGVVLTLSGGDFSPCPAVHGRRPGQVVRKLWAEGHGRFETRGRYAVGQGDGARWLTEDRCGATVIRVATARVRVTDLVRHRRLTVKAHQTYSAAA